MTTTTDLTALLAAVDAGDDGAREALSDLLEDGIPYQPYHAGWGTWGWWRGGEGEGSLPAWLFDRLWPTAGAGNRLYDSREAAMRDLTRRLTP